MRAQLPLFAEAPTAGGLVLGGLDLDTLLSRSLVAADATSITPDQHILLMLNSIDMTGDEAHALGAGRLNTGFASLGLRTMLSTQSLGPALGVLARYFVTCSSIFRMAVGREGDFARVSLRASGREEDRSEVLEEIWFNALYTFMSWFVGRRIPVLAATVARLGPTAAYRIQWAKTARLERGEVSSVLIPLECLAWPRCASDVEEPVWEALRFWMDDETTASADARTGLRAVFNRFDAPARARIGDAYTAVDIGERQRSRRIKREHGASFRDLRGDALVEAARKLLCSTDAPIDDIGAELGYSEERSFRRFIKSRTGVTPAQIRQGAMGTLPSPDPEVRSRIHALTRKMEF